jgi:hydroxypyruvate isomerase
MKIKQSVVFPMIKAPAMPLDEFFGAAANIGFAAAELWFRQELDLDEVTAKGREHGLEIVSMCGHGTHTRGLNQLEEHDRVEAELVASLQVATHHGIPGVIALSGNRNPGESGEDAIENCVRGLRRVAPVAEKLGVNINLELLNSKVDHAGYFCDHTALGVAICEQVASPRVKLLYDIYHMQIMEGDIIRTIRENIRWIGHFHTAGNPGRQDMDDTQELNYRAICRAIAATGYDLYVGHEFRPKGDPIEALRHTFAICNGE